jgi:hypothetical protein
MHRTLFLKTLDINKYILYNQEAGGLAICANASKFVFDNSKRFRIQYLFLTIYLVVWQYKKITIRCFWTLQTLINTFYYDQESCGPARSMHKSSRTYFWPLQMFLNTIFITSFGGQAVCKNASKLFLKTSTLINKFYMTKNLVAW